MTFANDYRARLLAERHQRRRTVAVPHALSRPDWNCVACRKPWPCTPAREQLSQQYGRDRVGLAIYMGALLTHAVEDMPEIATKELFERFIRWTR